MLRYISLSATLLAAGLETKVAASRAADREMYRSIDFLF